MAILNSDMEKSIEFMSIDFSESYTQLRHYDKIIIDSFKLVFSIYIAVFGGVISLFNANLEIDLLIVFQVVVALTFLFGIAIFWYILETRKYFVKTARYLNEIRDFHITKLGVTFGNKSNYFCDYTLPKFCNWSSSHIFILLILMIFNTFDFGLFLFLFELKTLWLIIFSLLMIIIHIVFLKIVLRE